MPIPSQTTVQTWILLARAYGAAIKEIEQALSDNGLPPLSWYDILLELERAGADGLRQFELERALLLKQYSASRLAERMEKAKLLRREPSKTDGRGKRLLITGEGRALRQRMWGIYGPKIHDAIGRKLTRDQCRELGNLLRELVIETDT